MPKLEKRPWRQPGANPYQTPAWRALRKACLKREPFCRFCGARSGVADHIQPHRGDLRHFFDPGNLQALCRTCHNSVKARDEQGDPNRGVTPDGLPLDPAHLWNKG